VAIESAVKTLIDMPGITEISTFLPMFENALLSLVGNPEFIYRTDAQPLGHRVIAVFSLYFIPPHPSIALLLCVVSIYFSRVEPHFALELATLARNMWYECYGNNRMFRMIKKVCKKLRTSFNT